MLSLSKVLKYTIARKVLSSICLCWTFFKYVQLLALLFTADGQIFGRAGRPGYETSGEGYICTTQEKLDHYLQSIMSQHPIESKWVQTDATWTMTDEQVHSWYGRFVECRDCLGHDHKCSRCHSMAWLYLPLRQDASRAIHLRYVLSTINDVLLMSRHAS